MCIVFLYHITLEPSRSSRSTRSSTPWTVDRAQSFQQFRPPFQRQNPQRQKSNSWWIAYQPRRVVDAFAEIGASSTCNLWRVLYRIFDDDGVFYALDL